ncbi:smoothelin-like protein 2 isoform X2 [Stegostoma tigrinum]|uniref:smoothelin-like protein 2 isoform X2 n=1 Tax=Stegostoma tigrinum TaxID=3053191 RepID=UPI00287097CD|nr:smoothelin-like protein 2 isoform X2 [Stegostoma tigrinum]
MTTRSSGMNTEPSKSTQEDSGMDPARLCPSPPEDPTGAELPTEMGVLPTEKVSDEPETSVQNLDPDPRESEQGADTGNLEEAAGVDAGGESSLDAEVRTESHNSLEGPQLRREGQTVEGEAGVAESLSMSSLSRSITKEDVTCLKSPLVEEARNSDRMREIGRSQTVPRSFGAQSRRAAMQKADAQKDTVPASAGSKMKPQRSTSFGKSGGSSVKQKLLEWCRQKTRGYQHVDIQNFSTSWNDGMAFCALVHKFFPDSFDYSALAPKNRRQNFELAFSMAEARADCVPLIEVEDMIRMGRHPDAKCVFTYVQSLCRHLHSLETRPPAAPATESNPSHPCPPLPSAGPEECDGGAQVEGGSGEETRD